MIGPVAQPLNPKAAAAKIIVRMKTSQNHGADKHSELERQMNGGYGRP
jgi:hypothetical protein